MNHDKSLDTLINQKVVRAHPWMQTFFCKVLNLAHVLVWCSMVLDNMEPMVRFLVCGLPSPCLVLRQKLFDELFDKMGVLVPKFGWGGGQQFLKVLMSNI